VQTKLDRHPGAGLRGLLSQVPPVTMELAIIPLRSSGGESGNLVIALTRRCQATSPDAPTKSRELRGSVVMQECLPGQNTRAVIFKAAPKTGVRKRSLRFWVPAVSRVPSRRRPGSLRYNCVLCSIRRLPCHPDSSGVPAGRATARGAAIGAPTGRHPARQLRRSAVLKSLVGASFP